MQVLHFQILFMKMDGFKEFFKIPQSYCSIFATGGNYTISGCKTDLLFKETPNKEAFIN